MGVATESGYVWTQGRNARLLHDGNRFRPRAITATSDAGTTADLVENVLTRDRWVPFSNALASPADFSTADWTQDSVSVGEDGQTLTETASGATTHQVRQSLTLTPGEWVFSVTFAPVLGSNRGIQLIVTDGAAANFSCIVVPDLTLTANTANGQLHDNGDGSFTLRIYGTVAAGSATFRARMVDETPLATYAGDGVSQMKILKVTAHESAASLRVDTFGAKSATCIAVAAHNLGTGMGRITFEHDSDEDDTWTAIGAVTPADDGPVMFFFDAVTSPRWRITADRGVLPEIGVLRIGDPLVFERAFYAGFTPAAMNRTTEVIGNISRTGELLGRSVKRTLLQGQFQWQNLSEAWVRANIDGPGGVIRSLETGAAFMAWRPEVSPADASYLMRAAVTPPQAQGVKDLWTFSLQAEVHADG